jgi:hypothetical protein
MERYVKEVLAALAYLHGWEDPTKVTKEAWRRIGQVLERNKSVYTYGHQMGLPPHEVARRIQTSLYTQLDESHVVAGR